MKILVLNCGSSSIKYQLFDMSADENVLAKGLLERIGQSIGIVNHTPMGKDKMKYETPIPNHTAGIEIIINLLLDKEVGVINSLSEIKAAGHRVAHGGEHFKNSVLINKDTLTEISNCIQLAPLHNPANLKGILAVEKLIPGLPQVAVFDTSFHQTMPASSYMYAVPYKMYENYKIRRYGFHGTSHKFVAQKACNILGWNFNEKKIITCHLGNGASITAIKNGKSVDTSMGFTPLEGLMMGTRCGDIDPAIPIHLQQQLGFTVDEVNTILNKKSGMLGLSHISNDMREIEDEILIKNNPKAIMAMDVYCYRIKKYIGSYFAALNGLDVLVFTGGIGENMSMLREQVCREMEAIGIKLNLEENSKRIDGIQVLSAEDSKVIVLKIPTNEELMIALETESLLRQEK